MTLHRRINFAVYVASIGKAKLRRLLKECALRYAEHDLKLVEEWSILDAMPWRQDPDVFHADSGRSLRRQPGRFPLVGPGDSDGLEYLEHPPGGNAGGLR